MEDRSWEVLPGVGVGPLRFGTSRAALHAMLGPCEAFRRAPYSVDFTDQYDAGLLMLTCSADEGLYLVEIPDPDGVRYRGVPLAGPAAEVIAALRAAGETPVADDGGWLLADGALALAVSSAEVAAVTVVAPGRHGGELERLPGGAGRLPAPRKYEVLPDGLDAVSFGASRDAVRDRFGPGSSWRRPAGSREPDQDHFWEEGLVVQYGPDARVERIFVTRADEVLFDGIDLIEPLPATPGSVRDALTAAGHQVEQIECGLRIAGTGVEAWTMRAAPGLPVAAVSLTPAPVEKGAGETLF